MQTGVMPSDIIEGQPPLSKADWGPRAHVGISGAMGEFMLMQADPEEAFDSFWALPTDLKVYNNNNNFHNLNHNNNHTMSLYMCILGKSR